MAPHLLAQDLRLYRRASDDDPPGQLCEVESGPDIRLNDGRVDARGRLWIGTMDNQLYRPNGALYRVDADGRTTRMFGDVIVTNGIAFSPDNRTLYFTDTRRYRTWQFDFDLDDGAISNRRLFADYSASGEARRRVHRRCGRTVDRILLRRPGGALSAGRPDRYRHSGAGDQSDLRMLRRSRSEDPVRDDGEKVS